MRKYYIFPLFLTLFLLPLLVMGQGSLGNSPYSRYGLGELAPQAGVRNQMMSGTGISMPHFELLNLTNPALSVYNRMSMIDFAFSANLRQVTSDGQAVNFRGGHIGYLMFSFPISPRLTLQAGLTPFSFMDYAVNTQGTVQNDTLSYSANYSGQGGLTKMHISTGYNMGKGWCSGIELGYVFGSLTDYKNLQLQPTSINYINAVESRTRHSAINLKFGIAKRHRIKKYEKPTYLNFGATYRTGVVGSAYLLQQANLLTTGGSYMRIDTLQNETRVSTIMPSKFGVGFSIDRPLHWSLGIDFNYENWSAASINGQSYGLHDSYRISMGGEWIPAFDKTGYLNIIEYRAGMYFEQLPLNINNQSVSEFGTNFGLSLPIFNKKTLKFLRPYINLSFGVGWRTSPDPNLVSENIYKLTASFTLNDKRWFQKRKIQ